MSHPDEGTIQMLLDGELDPAERRRVERHVDECAACAATLAEARGFLEEADRLVGVLEVPQRAPRRRVAPRRRALVRTLAWAASIVIAVGVGYWGRGAPEGTAAPAVLQEGDRPTAAAVTPPEPASPASALATAQAVPSAAKPGARRDVDARAAPVETKSLAASNENEAARKEVATPPPAALERGAGIAAPVARDARLNDEPILAWRVISMEEAVRLLGGQLRLIDGLTPDRVETGPGTAVPGADPHVPLVRVVYAAGAVILDEQRPAGVADGRQQDAAKAVGGVAAETSATAWQQRGEIRFVVTGSVASDSLRALGERVR